MEIFVLRHSEGPWFLLPEIIGVKINIYLMSVCLTSQDVQWLLPVSGLNPRMLFWHPGVKQVRAQCVRQEHHHAKDIKRTTKRARLTLIWFRSCSAS